MNGHTDEVEMVVCRHCCDTVPISHTDAIDVSREDEYYPEYIYVCRGHEKATLPR